MDGSQLELFQTPGIYELAIFDKAKQLKTLVQEFYNKSKIFDGNINFDDKYAILNVTVDIDQIRDQDSLNEPSTPKMFIWQFLPSISIDSKVLLKAGDSLNNISPKIIPKWINEIFTAESFSHTDFLKYTTQYFTLELINVIFENKEMLNMILEEKKERKLIIYIDSKLFISHKVDSSSLLERDIINKIKNFYSKLKSIQRDDWYFIGNYDDFTNDGDLLKDLDNNETFKKENEKILGTPNDLSKIKWIYQNDYLFLNNLEFYFQGKYNTHNWDNNFIVSPVILNSELDGIDESKLASKENRLREIYCYLKKAPGERFFRTDILFPNILLKKEIVIEIIQISQKIKNDRVN